MKNLRVENERLQEVVLVQALAIDLMQRAVIKLSSPDNDEAWMKAIRMATIRAHDMTLAEKQDYKRQRNDLMREFLQKMAERDPSGEGVAS